MQNPVTPGWAPGAHPCATGPAVCLLKELRFHVDDKGLDLISLATVNLPTHVAEMPQVTQIHFLQRGSQREALSEMFLLECLPFLAELSAWDCGPKQLSTSNCYRALGFGLCALESLGWALYSTCEHRGCCSGCEPLPGQRSRAQSVGPMW